jgi:hypothetical protein
MPKPPKLPSARHANNLATTLRAISCLSDEQVSAWGQEFDWSLPVENAVIVGNDYVGHKENAGVRLLLLGDPRLSRLLLRPDMFAMADLVSRAGARHNLHDDDYSRYGSSSNLLTGLLAAAYHVCDLSVINQIEQWPANRSDGFPAWKYLIFDGASPLSGLLSSSQPISPGMRKGIIHHQRRYLALNREGSPCRRLQPAWRGEFAGIHPPIAL